MVGWGVTEVSGVGLEARLGLLIEGFVPVDEAGVDEVEEAAAAAEVDTADEGPASEVEEAGVEEFADEGEVDEVDEAPASSRIAAPRAEVGEMVSVQAPSFSSSS